MSEPSTPTTPTQTPAGSPTHAPAAQTPPAAPAAPGTSLLGGDPPAGAPAAPVEQPVGDRPDWLPEKFWTDKGPNVEHLAKSYHGLEQLLGKKAQALVPPSDKSTPEEIQAWRKALGVPESPDGYALKPENLPPGVQWDDNSAKAVAALAHKHNIPAAAMKDLMAFDLQRQQQWTQAAAQIAQQELAEGRETLKTTFGEKYDANIALAKRAVATVNGNAQSHGFTDPEVVRVIVGLAQKLSDDTLVAGDSIGAGSAKSRAKDIMTNPQNPLHSRYLEADPEVVDMVRRGLTAA